MAIFSSNVWNLRKYVINTFLIYFHHTVLCKTPVYKKLYLTDAKKNQEKSLKLIHSVIINLLKSPITLRTEDLFHFWNLRNTIRRNQ